MLTRKIAKIILKLAEKSVQKIPGFGLIIELPDGSKTLFGIQPVRTLLKFHDWRVLRKLFGWQDQSIIFGEAFARGDIEIRGDIRSLLWAIYSSGTRWQTPFSKISKKSIQKKFSSLEQKQKIRSIYDGLEELYPLILDRDTMSYTVGLFKEKLPSIDEVYFSAFHASEQKNEYEKLICEKLDEQEKDDRALLQESQYRKIDLICRKSITALGRTDAKGLKVLDIGCGWGALVEHFAKKYGASVTGLTLSKDQARYSSQRAKKENLDIAIVCAHYKDFKPVNKFDIVTAVGMLEHVGQRHIGEFARYVRSILNNRGVAVIHNMTYPYELPFEPFIEKHIFPGAHIPAAHSMIEKFEREDFELRHYEAWRQNYAQTLQIWEANLWRNKDTIEHIFQEYCHQYPKRFPFNGSYHFRIWLLYIMSSRAAFENGTIRVGHSVFIPAYQNDFFPFEFGKDLNKISTTSK